MAEPPATTPAAATAASDALLATKLHIPPTRPGFVVRPQLTDRLTKGTAGATVLVCAPAGFGKTALLADWARRDPRPVAWLSLDDADNDPARFWRHVAAALDRVRPGVAGRVAALLQGLQPASFEAVVTTLVNELAGVAEEIVLVLDDYHLIQAPQVHQSLGFLLEHLPTSLRLVLAGRADPPLPLARLRARASWPSYASTTCASALGRPPSCCAPPSGPSCPRRPWRCWPTAPKAGWPGCSWRRCRCRVEPI
jgi:LuxR family transcriptional regulator, maltose regulon positive regulatory protein